MFIRVVYNENKGKELSIQHGVDCHKYTIFTPLKDPDKPDQEEIVNLVAYTKNGEEHFDVPKDGCNAIYVMNDFGKTVDVFRWPKET